MAWLCRSRKRCAAISHAGDLYVFRGARGDLIKIFWHDGLGMSLYAKRLEKGRFIWPLPADGVVGIRPRNWPTCSTESIGAIRVIRFVRNVLDNSLTLHFFTSCPPRFVFYLVMDSGGEAFPNDIAALKAELAAARDRHIIEAARAAYAEAELAVARAKASDDQALIAHQQLRIEKLTRELYGPRSERTSRLLDQIELQFEELESSATEDEIAAEMAVAKTTTVAAFTRKRRRASRSPSICRASG